MRKTFLYLGSLFLFFLASCEKPVTYKLPQYPPKIVLNSTLAPDSLIRVDVSRSLNINESSYQDLFLDNATVSLYENDNLLEILPLENNGIYRSASVKPVINSTYRIEVSAEGYDDVFASESIPELVKIQSFDTNRVEIIEDFTRIPKLKYTLSFDDPAAKENFYMIEAIFSGEYQDENSPEPTYPISFSYNLDLDTEDPLLLNNVYYINEKLLFSDEIFNGKSVNLSFYSDPVLDYTNQLLSFSLTIYLKSISKSYYLYLSSRQRFEENQDNPFSEPVKVYKNVTNGFGILGSFSYDQVNIHEDSSPN